MGGCTIWHTPYSLDDIINNITQTKNLYKSKVQVGPTGIHSYYLVQPIVDFPYCQLSHMHVAAELKAYRLSCFQKNS